MSISIDLYVDQGTDFLTVMPPVTDATGNTVDLTTYTTTVQMRLSYSSNFAVNITGTISDAVDGIITLTLPANETMGLTPTRYVYDVLITDGNNFTTRVFEGMITVNPGVTGKPLTNVIIPYIPDDFGGL